VDEYLAILDSGLESGDLYYNIGNSFLKLGRLGYAILYYEKAKRLIPGDSDLKANLSYARSLAESQRDDMTSGNFILNAIKAAFASYSLRGVIFFATLLYLTVIVLAALFIVNPLLARRFRIVLFAFAMLLVLNLSAAAVKYYDENMLKHGIVVKKEVECKYEPIDSSTTYYTLREGGDVIILSTKSDWRQIRRSDGRTGWVKRDAVEEI
jgi:tetratricopeptide (TPR) repeat protein